MTHGGSAYSNHDCRCAVCADGWRAMMQANSARLVAKRDDGHECRWTGHSVNRFICAICRKTRTKVYKRGKIGVGEFKEILHLTEKPTEESSPMRAHDVTSHGRPDAAL